MPFDLWLAFAAAAAILLVIPGPTVLTVVGYALSHGRRASLPLVAAVTLGDSTALAVSLLGLGAVLAGSAFWFTLVKWTGGLYLLWLGLRQLRSGLAAAEPAPAAPPGPRWRLFADTYLVTALNPKGILFFIAFLPQFISPAAPVTRQLWILGVTFVVLAAINATFYGLFAAEARRLLDSARTRRGVQLAGGSLLCAAGLWALLARRPAG